MKYYYLLIIIPLLFIVFSRLDWDSESGVSRAADAILLPHKNNAWSMMRANTFKYPPLQYLTYDLTLNFNSEKTAINKKNLLINARRITAIQTFCCILITVFIGTIMFCLPVGICAGFIYSISPLSVYYGRTTNLEQPYMFWFLLSLACFAYLGTKAEENKKSIYVAFLPGIFSFLTLATKDPAYAILPLPFIITVTYLYRKFTKKFWLKTVIALIGGILIGFCIYSLIWLWAGGWGVFTQHYNWLTHEGVERYRSSETNIIKKCFITSYNAIKNMLLGIGPFIVIPGVISFLIYRQKHRFAYLLLLSPALGVLLFFLPAARFSYQRFWLPALPAFCIFTAYLLYQMIITKKKYLLSSCLIIIILLHSFQGAMVLNQLNFNVNVQRCNKDIQYIIKKSNTPMMVGVATLRPRFYVIYSKDKKHRYSVKALRNWTMSSLGRIYRKQVPISLDDISLHCLPLSIIITGPGAFPILTHTHGYQKVNTYRQKTYLPLYFNQTPPNEINLFVKVKASQPIAFSNTLDDYIMVLTGESKLFENSISAQHKIGHILPNFETVPENIYVTNIAITLMAISYYRCGRTKNALKAFKYALKRWPSKCNEENLQNCINAK